MKKQHTSKHVANNVALQELTGHNDLCTYASWHKLKIKYTWLCVHMLPVTVCAEVGY